MANRGSGSYRGGHLGSWRDCVPGAGPPRDWHRGMNQHYAAEHAQKRELEQFRRRRSYVADYRQLYELEHGKVPDHITDRIIEVFHKWAGNRLTPEQNVQRVIMLMHDW